MNKRPKCSIVSERGQVVIPARLRRALGIRKDTRVSVFEQDGGIVIQPLNPKYLSRLQGSLKGEPSLLKTLLEERKQDRMLLRASH
jgi:AbrB family looped-hinge helix DNA binding protein